MCVNTINAATKRHMQADREKQKVPNFDSAVILRILHLAATESETHVDRILMFFCHNDQPISSKTVNEQLASIQKLPSVTEVTVDAIDLNDYDVLLERVI